MSGENYQLLKVAKELNVGIQTLADALKAKGHQVDSKPATKISSEQYQLLIGEFASEAKVKLEAASLKTDKPRNIQITADQVPKPKVVKQDDEEDQILIKNALTSRPEKPAAPKVEEKPKVVIETPVAEVPVVKEPEPAIEKVAEPVIEVKEEAVEDNKVKLKIKIAGKIDLNDVREDPLRPDKKSKSKTKSKEPEPEIVAPVAKVEEAPAPVKKKKPTEEPKEAPKVEAPVAKAPEEIKPIEVVAEAENKTVVMTPNYQKLEGLKILGKVNLPAVKEPEKKDSNNNNKRKRKRKAIGGEKIAIPVDDKAHSRSTDNRDRPKTPHTGGGGGNRPPRGREPVRDPRAEISDKEVQDKLKETLARLNPGSRRPNIGDVRSKIRRQKRDEMAERREEAETEKEARDKVLKVTEFVSASELAKMMDLQVTQIIQACFTLGMMVSINQRLDAETISIVADEFGFEVDFVSAEDQEEVSEEEDRPEDLLPRAPIVTVMGHVDHGKTSLLDYVRKANVVAGEAGGITQHIGAYDVTLKNGKHVTFLDTPGHEAFTAMRARGAKITDVVIIVIAADDSVMPQTKEAISHAQAAGVPIIFAFNKIDKDGADPERLRQQLSSMNILVEEWGGKYQTQEISAKKGLNVDLLLEKVLLESEMLELKANPNKRAVGSVIEATLDKGRGNVTTVMIQAGTLSVGDPILAGVFSGRVKAMFNERGQKVSKAGPSTPVTLLGLPGAPQAGDKFMAIATEQEAKEIANKRMQLLREQGLRTHKHITLDEIGRRLAIGNFKELNLIVKGDVDGSIEALSDSLLKLSSQEIQINVVHKAVGQISESDVMLASASDAIIIGFNVRPSGQARKLAENEDIDIRLYSIIYDAINEVKSAMEGMLAPTLEEKITCNVEIREVFKISKLGAIAGCMVTDGKIARNSKVRVIRDGVVVHTGELSSLKRFKDDVKEVATGYECGLTIHNFNDIQEGDIVEGYEQVEVKRKLS
jgi:translation initiation factor IF-2